MKKSRVYKPPPPKEVVIPPAAEVDALEKRLRLAAGAYYEDSPIKKLPGHSAWWHNKPPGIVRRFAKLARVLLPTARYKKRTP